MIHLLLSPLIFWTQTVEVFEYNKIMALWVTAVLLGALGLSALVYKAATWPGAAKALGAVFSKAGGLLRDPVALGFLLLSFSGLVSTVTSLSPRTSFFGAHESFGGLLTLLAYTTLFFATRWLCPTLQDSRRLLAASVVAAGVASVYALVQVGRLDPLRWQRAPSFRGLVSPFSTLGNPNFVAAFLVMAWPLTAYFVHRAAQQRQRLGLVVFLLVGAFSWLTVLAAMSRGAWLALACTVVALGIGWFAVHARRQAALAVSALPLTVLGLLIANWVIPGQQPLLDRLMNRTQSFFRETGRWHLWRGGLHIFWEHPVWGCGLDTFHLAFQRERTAEYWKVAWGVTPDKAHNEAIHVLATHGLLGGVALGVLTAGLGLAGWRASRRTARDDRLFAVALAAGVVGFYVQNLFSFTVAGCGTLFVTLAALLSRLGQPGEAPEASTLGEDSQAFVFVAAAVLAALGFFANVGSPLALSWGAAWGCLAVLTALAVVVRAALALEAGERAAAVTRVPAPLPQEPSSATNISRWRHVLQIAIWGCAALVLINGVFIPVQANRACRRGLDLLAQHPRQALEQLQRAVALDPCQDMYWVRLGVAADLSSRSAPAPDERRRLLLLARQAFERSVELVPASAANHSHLGHLLGVLALEGLATAEQAFVQFDTALELDGLNAYLYAGACRTALDLGDARRARHYAARGVELYPGFAVPRAQLGQAALMDDRFEEAVRHLEQAVALWWYGWDEERVLAWLNLARTRTRLQRFPEAVAAAREAVRWAPKDAEAGFQLATALELLGERAAAVSEYRRVLALRPNHALARQALRRLDVRQ